MMGKKARKMERATERERFGERGRATQQQEKMAWVDVDRWSKSTNLQISTTPENFLRVSIN
jgi:hypothetical protein